MLIRLATRNSPLALWQANHVQAMIKSAHPEVEVELLGMTTKGDQILDRSLLKVGGKGLFMKELEEAMLDGRADIAVHSMKDVTLSLPKGLGISAVCTREVANDAFVSNEFTSLDELGDGAIVGTSSLRRVSQLKHHYPKLVFKELRGNVNTRLAKLDAGEYDAIVLASAGLIRLGFEDRIKQHIPFEKSLPAVGQGIVGIESRSDDAKLNAILSSLNDVESEICLAAERAVNAVLDGGCSVPIAAHAVLINEQELDEQKTMVLNALVGDVETGEVVTASAKMSVNNLSDDVLKASNMGKKLAKELQAKGAQLLIDKSFAYMEKQ